MPQHCIDFIQFKFTVSVQVIILKVILPLFICSYGKTKLQTPGIFSTWHGRFLFVCFFPTALSFVSFAITSLLPKFYPCSQLPDETQQSWWPLTPLRDFQRFPKTCIPALHIYGASQPQMYLWSILPFCQHPARQQGVKTDWKSKQLHQSLVIANSQVHEVKVQLNELNFLLGEDYSPSWSTEAGGFLDFSKTFRCPTMPLWTKCPAHSYINAHYNGWPIQAGQLKGLQ